MAKLEVFCKNCNTFIGDNTKITFYQQSPNTPVHLIIKPERKNEVLELFLIKEQPEKKSKKYAPEIIVCKKCDSKLGSNANTGPNDRPALCYKAEIIYFIETSPNGQKKRSDFDYRSKWKFEKDKFPIIELRNFNNFDGNSEVPTVVRTDFIETVYPSLNDLLNFNIAQYVEDTPRTYQTELYSYSLFENTIVYLPTGSGKTMISAMLIAHMKRLNPKKKVFFVVDRVPLVFQQSSYLRFQCNLTTGEFCGENKALFESQLDADIYVLTAGFLVNMLLLKKLYLEDCSCLIFDEIHHAKYGHHYVQIIENHYYKIDRKYKPRILGMTASPTSGTRDQNQMHQDIVRLCSLIEGTISMPFYYRQDFDKFVVRPPMTFMEANSHSNEDILIQKINEFILPFMHHLNSSIDFKSNINVKNTALRNYLTNVLKDQTIQRNLKQFVVGCFLQSIVGSIEIMKIFGTSQAVQYLNETINKEFEKNKKNQIWLNEEIKNMNFFLQSIQYLTGQSGKKDVLISLLKDTTNYNSKSRILVFVRSRKTARLLFECLNSDEVIKKLWKPKYCVGQAGGGLDGMTWYDDQEPILNSFNEGQSRLLVSTSVLQEGLDVQICDKVILFDPLWSLVQYVQSRGRARHKDSQFIVIDTLEQKKVYDKLIESEKICIHLIYSITSFNRKVSREYIDAQINLVKQTVKTVNINQFSRGKNKKFRFTLQIFLIDGGLFIDLITCLKQCKGFVQCDAVKDSFLGQNLFNNFDCFNCLFEIKSSGKQKQEDNWQIFNTIKFILNSKLFKSCVYLFKVSNSNQTNSNFQSMSSKIEFGNLAMPNEYFNNLILNQNVKFLIDFCMRSIKILLLLNQKLYKLEFEFDSIDHLISIDCDQEDFNVYIPFKRAPFIFKEVDDKNTINNSNLKSADEEYIIWDRAYLDLKGLSLKLNFPNSEKSHLIEALSSLKAIYLTYNNVQNKNVTYSLDDLRRDFKFKNFSTCYSLEAFISQNYYLLDGKINAEFVQKLNSFSSDTVEKILECLSSRLHSKRFLDLNITVDEILKNKDNLNYKFDIYQNNLKISLFRRATITPTRIILYFPEPNFSNRVTREYNSDNFIRIRFRDEDLRKLNMSQTFSDMSEIYAKIRRFLLDGLKLWDRNYHFLAMSSSQLRENGCWLINRTILNPDKIRDWMGNFKNIRCIGKYAARLGQSLSSSVETFFTENYCMIKDITVGDYCFTDGIGKISLQKALEISHTFYNRPIAASAYQIRFAGFKGVVAVDPNLKNYELQFRDSMKKFDSIYTRLDVLNLTEYIPCYLNRQIILILSALGIHDSVFENLQDKMLGNLSNLLIDRMTASLSIVKYYRSVFSNYKHSDKLNYTYEPFFRDLLKTIYQKSLTDLIKKSRIFVQKGRILMGTIDETGTLKQNEIFVQVSKQFGEEYDLNEAKDLENGNIIINKEVVVAKNPCMHPGDVRVLKAVDRLELRHMVDCVVFPSVGPRPITNMCSGSDLDGDLYFVAWEPSLIPFQVEEPMNYLSPKAKEKDSDIQVEDVISFFVNFIEMDQLGRIANAHVAISDQSKLGVKDPICIELAKAFSLAVDFPKTGVLAKLPDQIKKLKYPDFMEKSGSNYRSEKIIGKLYRKCKNIFLNDNFRDKIALNESLLVDGFEKFVPEAKELYQKYRFEIERIMQYFNCSQEAELFVGIYLNSVSSDEAKDFFKLSSFMIKKLWSYMREKFMRTLKNEYKINGEEERIKIQIVSAWYFVCYSHKENSNLRILSFPWILEDCLNLIEIKNYDLFSQSIFEKFIENRHDFQMISRFAHQIDLKSQIEKITGLKYVLTGSFGLFLFEDQNDVQLIVYNPEKRKLLTEKVSENLEDYFDNVFYNDGVITCDESEKISFILTDSSETIKRFLYLRKSIFNNPELLLVFYFSVHFAKEDNLFITLNQDRVKLDSYLIFLLDYLQQEKFVSKISESEIEQDFLDLEKKEKSDCYDNWMNVHDYLDDLNSDFAVSKQAGKMILNFYQYMAFLNGRIKFLNVELDEHISDILKAHFYKVFNFITKTLDISKIWSSMGKLNEPVFKQKFSFAKKKGKSPNLFVENASLLLFSNLKSNFDRIEFELYRGMRRSLHLHKECYTGKIQRSLTDYSLECFNEFYRHSIQQFNKAKEMRSDYKFRIQIKFGDSYFTNVPSISHDSSSLPLIQLKEALKKGYKNFNYNYIEKQDKNNVLTLIDENNNFDDEALDIGEIDILDEYDMNDELEKKERKKKKKKKRVISQANTAFDSNVKTEANYLNNLFLNNEFDTKISNCYVVYAQLKNIESMRKNCYRLKYDPDIKLVRIETLPIKWLNIDIRNQCENKENRDVRFNLVSEKEIDLDDREMIDENESNMILREGIIKKNADNEPIVIEELRNSPSIFVRYGESIKYYGSYENWKPLFDMANVKFPENISNNLLQNFRVSLSESKEYSDFDERGVFMTQASRSEVSISSKVDINTLKAVEINDLILLSWHLIQVFSRILS
ncbi:unnamed protein product [Brachionus calyciflorus]|uniref:RNA-directed RNA polymerase n=1 Tax=Brachionus calyciflorus TaxID=104777 RepID=A0A813NRY6_9BILA|nr:unnamed protein product [Brachionus calyciflorus]